jgi:hypothetical protein
MYWTLSGYPLRTMRDLDRLAWVFSNVCGEIEECTVDGEPDARFVVEWTPSPFTELKERLLTEALDLERVKVWVKVRLAGPRTVKCVAKVLSKAEVPSKSGPEQKQAEPEVQLWAEYIDARLEETQQGGNAVPETPGVLLASVGQLLAAARASKLGSLFVPMQDGAIVTNMDTAYLEYFPLRPVEEFCGSLVPLEFDLEDGFSGSDPTLRAKFEAWKLRGYQGSMFD